MSCNNSPQRGCIDHVVSDGDPLPSGFDFSGIAFLGWKRIYPHGYSRTDSCRGRNRFDVIVLRRDRPKDPVDPKDLSGCRKAVLLRTATTQEHEGWTVNGNLCTVELLRLRFSLLRGKLSVFTLTGRKDSYAEQY